jgi:hypothetical protein
MAENKTINIKINSNTKEATKDTKDYNKAIGSTKKQYDAVLKSGDSYEKQLSDINKIVKETPLNVRDMNKQIQAYQSIALSAGRETPVGKEALKKASELRDRYIDIQNETKRLADDQKNLQGAIQLVGTGVAAFGGVQSAMALTGVESEKLRETMVKLQAAQTLMTSINQIATAAEKESSAMLLLKSTRTKVLASSTYAYATAQGVATKGAKLLRVAMVSTGVGALVVGIGLLVANFDKVKAVLTDVNKGFKEGGLMTKALMIAFAPLIATVKLFQKGLQAIGVLETEQEKTRKANAEASAKRSEANAVRLQKEIDNLKEIRENLDKNYQAYQRQLNAEIQALEQSKEGLKNKEKIAEIDEQIRQKSIEGIEEEYNTFKESQELKLAEYEKEIKKNQARINAAKARGSSQYKTELFYVQKYTAEANKLRNELNTNNFTQYQEYINKLEAVDIEKAKKEETDLKERQSKYKSYLQERLNAARKIEDLENSLMEDGIEKDLEINRDKFRRLQEDTKKNTKLTAKERKKLNDLYTEQQEQSELKIREKYDKIDSDREKKRLAEIEKQNNDFLKTIEDIAEQNYQNTLTDEERELTAVQDKYFALEEAAKGNAEALNEIEIARLNELNEIYLKYDDERDAAQKVRDDKAKADALALQEYKINVVQGGLSAINDIASLFAKGNEKQQKRAFQVQKAVGIAQATINTAQAITKVFAETTDFTPTQSLRIANAVGIGIAGAAQIASIASQQFTGGGDVESPTDIGGAGGGEAVAPSFNVVGDSGINQIAQLQSTPVQAFVVSGEVTTSQALDRNRVENATL